MEKKDGSFINHFIIIGGGAFFNLFIGVLTTPLITRLVDPTEYGQLSIFTMYANIGLMVLCLGLDQSLVRFFYREESATYRKALLKKCIIYPLISTVFATIIVGLLTFTHVINLEFDNSIIIFLCIYEIVLIVNRFTTLILRLNYKSSQYTIAGILQKFVYVSLAIVGILMLKNHYIYILIIATMISYVVPTLWAIISEKEFYSTKSRHNTVAIDSREIITYGLPFILSLGITTLFQAIDKFSLSFYCSYREVGIYSSAMNLVHVFGIFQTAFNTLWGPMAMEHFEKHPKDKTFYQKGNQIITVIMFFVGISLIIFKDVFSYLLGAKYREAAYMLPFLIFSPIMYTISESTCTGIAFMKKTKMNIWVAVGACVTNIIGNTVLVPIYGGRGSAISTGISYMVFWLLRTVISNHYFYVDFKMKKITVMLLYTSAYALYNVFHGFNLVIFIGYLGGVVLLLLLYRETICDIIKFGKMYAFDFVKKKRGNPPASRIT